MKATKGRIVHVEVDSPGFFGSGDTVHAAMVVGVNENGTINLRVMPNSVSCDTVFLGDVSERVDGALGRAKVRGRAEIGASWFWPPREEPNAAELGAAARAAGEPPLIRVPFAGQSVKPSDDITDQPEEAEPRGHSFSDHTFMGGDDTAEGGAR